MTRKKPHQKDLRQQTLGQTEPSGPSIIPLIGLAGGIGSGKSLLASELAKLGCALIDADKLAKQLRDLPRTREILRAKLGDSIFGKDGVIDEKALSELVFSPQSTKNALDILNSIVHPLVIAKCLELIEQYRQEGRAKAIVLDAPLLFEAGLDSHCDAVIFVNADDALRSRRVQDQRRWSRDKWADIEKKQISLDKKRALSDYIVENSSSKIDLRCQIQQLFPRILGKTSSGERSKLLSSTFAGPPETALGALGENGEKVSKTLRPNREQQKKQGR